MKIAIIGAGAAGCFSAIRLAELRPDIELTLFEARRRPLAKVAVTGGGRCNLTNTFAEVNSLEEVYPRGARLMKRLLREYGHNDVMQWFERRGVPLVAQDDQCVFPRSQRASQIVETLLEGVRRAGVVLKTEHRLTSLVPCSPGGDATAFRLVFNGDVRQVAEADRVIVTTGGHPRLSMFGAYSALHLPVVSPVPSLFSFSMNDDLLCRLTGVVVDHVVMGVAGTKFRASGPLLITHRGVSGPVTLRLSAQAARYLSEHAYRVNIVINWLGGVGEEEFRNFISHTALMHPVAHLSAHRPEGIQARLWHYLLSVARLRPDMRWNEIGHRGRSRLVATLTGQSVEMTGRNPHKEEFVTCGGISLAAVHPGTLESRDYRGLFFAGEVLDIDAVTGGFNLQAAWTTGYAAAGGAARLDKEVCTSCCEGNMM